MDPARHRAGRKASPGTRAHSPKSPRPSRRRSQRARAVLARRVVACRAFGGLREPPLLRRERSRSRLGRCLSQEDRRLSRGATRGWTGPGVLGGRPLGLRPRRRAVGPPLLRAERRGRADPRRSRSRAGPVGGFSAGAGAAPRRHDRRHPRVLAPRARVANRAPAAENPRRVLHRLGRRLPGRPFHRVRGAGEHGITLCELESGNCRKARIESREYLPVQWSADGRFLYLSDAGEIPVNVVRYEIATARTRNGSLSVPRTQRPSSRSAVSECRGTAEVTPTTPSKCGTRA